MGTEDGLQPGTYLTVYRANELGPKFARKLLGRGVVVTVQPSTAAVKLTDSFVEIYVGDGVEIQ